MKIMVLYNNHYVIIIKRHKIKEIYWINEIIEW